MAPKRQRTPEQQERHAKWMKQWYLDNKERIHLKSVEIYRNDPEGQKAKAKEWARNHKEIVNKRNSQCNIRKRESLSPEELEAYRKQRNEYNMKRYYARKNKPKNP